MKPAKHIGSLVFSIIFLLVCLFPFAGLAFAPEQVVSDNDTLSEAPSLTNEDGRANLYFLSNAGEYFEDHFAFRNEAIDLNARLRVGLFATSPTDQVIVGEDGWLFYGGTLGDFRADNPLTDREIFNIAHNLELMQGYTEAQGASFVFTIAPNKNTLYPQYMPYYYTQGTNDSMERLAAALEERGVNYVNLFELFEGEEDELYYQTDSHWTTEGALLVSNALLEAAGVDEVEVEDNPETEGITGDIEQMLYPVSAWEEESLALETGSWRYVGEASSVEDGSIETQGEGGGTLLMQRDSFANSLIPLMAPQFETAHFSKLIPYNLSEVNSLQASAVVVERAERNVRMLGEEAPFMLAPRFKLEVGEQVQSNSVITWQQDEDYRVIEGWVDEAVMSEDSQIFVTVEGPEMEETTFVPFYLSTDKEQPYGFRFYLDEHALTDGSYTFTVLVLDDDAQKPRIVLEHILKH